MDDALRRKNALDAKLAEQEVADKKVHAGNTWCVDGWCEQQRPAADLLPPIALSAGLPHQHGRVPASERAVASARASAHAPCQRVVLPELWRKAHVL